VLVLSRPIAVGGSAVNIRGSLHKLKVPKHGQNGRYANGSPDVRLEQPETSRLEASVRIPLGKPPKKHAHSVALFAMYYNFVRIHKTLRTTPAMAVEEEASTLTAY
jgi:hypothetical protein